MTTTNDWQARCEQEAARIEWDAWAERQAEELEQAIKQMDEGNMTVEEFDKRF
jgi:hypothetical protein